MIFSLICLSPSSLKINWIDNSRYGDDDATKPSEPATTVKKEEPKAVEATPKPAQPSEPEQTSDTQADHTSDLKQEAQESEYNLDAQDQQQQQYEQPGQTDGAQYDGQGQGWNEEEKYHPEGGNDGHHYGHNGQGYHQGGGSGSAILKEDGCVFSSFPSLSVSLHFAFFFTSLIVKREDTTHSDLEHLSYPSSSSKRVHSGSYLERELWQKEALVNSHALREKQITTVSFDVLWVGWLFYGGCWNSTWVFNILRTLRYNYLLLLLYLSCLHSYDSNSNPRLPHKEDLTVPSGNP